ncbi:hypothetical protein [Shimia abyssi]|uniref:Uncharacterized protein n=1 Tax=Shimia abyssi TaxID=1662395 RepID=A0A2P8F2Z1_9RHOB|nr:hypothetical protein [Shimia abyssi]PSL16056.1 hypothetical protein CLV88_12323 [Shimia abyssi]
MKTEVIESQIGDTAAASDVQDDQLRPENQKWSRKLFFLAWAIEGVLVAAGLGVAFAQAFSAPAGSGWLQAIPVFGVFVVLAAVELAKIPAATVVFHARGVARYLALVGLFVASLISFETVFNGIERYVHVTTQPVGKAREEVQSLRGEIEQLKHSGADDLKGEDIAQVDAERMAQLEQSLAIREKALQTARENLESPETRELKAQLTSLTEQQDKAGAEAGAAWQSEQEWIMTRLNGDGIDNRMRDQLNNRMRGMPAKQNVILEARAQFETEIMKLNAEIEKSITQPSPEALANVAQKQTERDEAAKALAAFERENSARADQRTATLLTIQSDKADRARQIEALEAEAIKAVGAVAHAAELSQMHRWASFVFGVEPADVQDNQAKQVGAVFGALLGIVAALTGSSVAMYSQWFKVRGVRPVVRVQEIEVEKIVEKEVEVPYEVEVPVLRYVYVPVPIGENVEDGITAILDALPPEAADELKAQMAIEFDTRSGEAPTDSLTDPDPDTSKEPVAPMPDMTKKVNGDDYARAA